MVVAPGDRMWELHPGEQGAGLHTEVTTGYMRSAASGDEPGCWVCKQPPEQRARPGSFLLDQDALRS